MNEFPRWMWKSNFLEKFVDLSASSPTKSKLVSDLSSLWHVYLDDQACFHLTALLSGHAGSLRLQAM